MIMAWSLVRTNISKPTRLILKEIVNQNNNINALKPCRELVTSPVSYITSKIVREEMGIKRPPPFPYNKKKYTVFHQLFDYTPGRFDDNSKIIVVDGNIAAGKTSFAKKLAEELDMFYVPEPSIDLRYINDYGYDLRNLDPQLPEDAKSYDLKKFYKDPHHRNAAAFQIDMFILRFGFYVDSLCHLLNTGQGVVMDRSVYSDIVFLETMVKFGYVSRAARKVYYKLRESVLIELLKPHLVIYLDVPAQICHERIKRRALPYEIETSVLSTDYLQSIEDVYKNNYLKLMSEHSEIMVFDWSEYGDVEVVVEDIERIDFDRYDTHDAKCKDWRKDDSWEWADFRYKYTSNKDSMMKLLNTIHVTAPELILSPEDSLVKETVIEKAPGEQYAVGFNPELGDKWVIFKTNTKPRMSTIPESHLNLK